MSQTSKVILAIIITAIVVGGGFYYRQSQNVEVNQLTNSESPPPTTTGDVANAIKEDYSTITILVPENYDLYEQNMTEFVQVGGEDPLVATKFVEKKLTIPYTDDPIKASAQAAAEEIAPSGGPTKASVAYFKIENDTAYVLLDIDLDGWAGVSVSRAIIHPLIEKTLMQFPEITKAIFDYAPGDK